jgi:myosin protein heavy chain
MVSKISDASVAVTATNKRETKSKGEAKTDAPKTKDGAIEALCKAGNFYDFEK